MDLVLRVRWIGLAVAALLALTPEGLAGGEPGGQGSPRDAVWRNIFARPAEVAGGTGSPPGSEAAIALGARLFRDRRLSGDGQRACSSCHQPARAFTDGRQTALGRDDTPLSRNTPSLVNAGWGKSYYWDGREPTLESQARVPITTANELGGSFVTIIGRLSRDGAMRDRFARAFPNSPRISEESISAALAAYERTLVAPRTRFDRWVEGEDRALSRTERDGFALFVGKAGCVACHGGWRFTDDGFHDIGRPGDDPGRGAVAGGIPGLAQFKTPSLRGVARTAPYMHDGSLPTLRSVVDHYAGGLVQRPSLAANIVRDLVLSAEEKAALVAFLGTL